MKLGTLCVAFALLLSGTVAHAQSTRASAAPTATAAHRNQPDSFAGAPRMRAGIALREFSLVGLVSADLHGRTDAIGGAAVGLHGVGDMDIAALSVRYRDTLALGYMSGGIAGEMSVDVAAGTHIMLGASHGPVVRGGLRARLLGNDALYDSLIELPQAQLGYQWLQGPLQLELAARGGLMLDGRLFLPGVRHNFGLQPEIGAYSTLRYQWLRADLEWSWLRVDGSFAHAQRGEARLCGASVPFSVCMFATRYFASAKRDAADASWLQLGLSLSVITELVR